MYELIYVPRAQRDLDEIFAQADEEDDELAERLAEELDRSLLELGSAPVTLSEPGDSGYASGQLYRFIIDDEATGRRFLITVRFKYRADEMQIDILQIGCEWLFAP